MRIKSNERTKNEQEMKVCERNDCFCVCRPENVPRLYDLIDVPDESVRPAFYYVMRDTLVANDLDQATRIGYGRVRHRVVTLGGELIEPSGQSLLHLLLTDPRTVFHLISPTELLHASKNHIILVLLTVASFVFFPRANFSLLSDVCLESDAE